MTEKVVDWDVKPQTNKQRKTSTHIGNLSGFLGQQHCGEDNLFCAGFMRLYDGEIGTKARCPISAPIHNLFSSLKLVKILGSKAGCLKT